MYPDIVLRTTESLTKNKQQTNKQYSARSELRFGRETDKLKTTNLQYGKCLDVARKRMLWEHIGGNPKPTKNPWESFLEGGKTELTVKNEQ